MDYTIGQIFVEMYPTEAAQWCNESGDCYIAEIDADEDGNRRFQIVAIPDPTLDELKDRKLAELSRSFNARVSGSFTTSQGYDMQFNESDSLKVYGYLMTLSEDAADCYLVQADDTMVTGLTYDTVKAVLAEMLAAYQACYQRKQELRAQINACTTAEELDAVEITWPV